MYLCDDDGYVPETRSSGHCWIQSLGFLERFRWVGDRLGYRKGWLGNSFLRKNVFTYLAARNT